MYGWYGTCIYIFLSHKHPVIELAICCFTSVIGVVCHDATRGLLHGDLQQLSSGLVLAAQRPLSCRQAIQVTAASATSGLAFT